MDAGSLGGVIGTANGILGGLIGAYFGVMNTNGPRERSFIIKTAIICWVCVIAFLAGLLFIPSPYNLILWIPYPILLLLGIKWCNQSQARTREEESGVGTK